MAAGAYAAGSLSDLSDISVTATDTSSNDSSGWLSGMGDLFQGIGSAIGSGLAATNVPKPAMATGWVFNPATGQYYNSATGQALTSTGTLPSAGIFTGSNSNFIILLVIAVAAFFLLRRGGGGE